MNKVILKFVMLFSPLYRRFNVNVDQLQIILFTKLLMDDRRPNMLMTGRRKQKKEYSNVSWTTMLLLSFMGLGLAGILAWLKQPLLGHFIYFTALMVMLALTLIADFTTVLIDVRDNFIILPRPVTSNTLIVSRILHITIHVSKLVMAITLPGLVYVFFAQGILAGLVFIIEILSGTLLSIFLVNIIYLLVLKLSSPERFKDFISYFQIVFSMIIFGAYYALPRLIDMAAIEKIYIPDQIIAWFLPPVWIAALHEFTIKSGIHNSQMVVFSLLAIFVPVLCLYLVITVFAPGFNEKLSSISGSELGSQTQKLKKGTEKNSYINSNFMQRLSSKIAKDPIEQAGFRLTWMLSSRYRDFKVKVYPAFAYVPVYFVYFAFMRESKLDISDKYSMLQEGKSYLLLLYFSGLVLIAALNQISFSEKYKASWILFSTPHHRPGKILSGMFKAIFIKYYLPYYLVIGGISLYIWGFQIWNDMLLVFFNTIIYGIITAWLTIKYMPFSQPQNMNNQGGKFLKNIFVLIIPGAFGMLHYFLSGWEWMITGWVIFAFVLAAYLLTAYKDRTWTAIYTDAE